MTPEPGHDGPAAVGQSCRGVDGSIFGSEPVLGLRVWLGIGYKPTDSTHELWQAVPGSGAVWAAWAV